ncbi:molecular chaperone [Mangrovibacter phragmitis]|nr:molecular chaperone [Mangrovibacter phragmitis]
MLALTHYALAATLQVAPVNIGMTTEQQATAVWLTNTGSLQESAQIRLYQWNQVNGKDVLEPTTTLVSSPAITSLGAGQKQLIRLIALKPFTADKEHSFRLIIDELPGEQANKDDHHAIHFLLRYSIPVFIASHSLPGNDNRKTATCQWDSAHRQLVLHNQGSRHIKLSDLQVENQQGRQLHHEDGLVGYLLPGSWQAISVPASLLNQAVTLKLTLNEVPYECPLNHTVATFNRVTAATHLR